MNTDIKKYVEDAESYFNWEYILDIISKLKSFSDNKLGFRLAGGQAEKRAAEFIAGELEKIGFNEVFIEKVPVDKWILRDAYVKIRDRNILIKGVTYAGYPSSKVEGSPVYLGRGTLKCYNGRDIRDKIALIELDDELVNSPLPIFKEASNKGAAGIIVTYPDKLSSGKEDTLFTADGEYFEGLSTVLYVSPKDFQVIKKIAEENSELNLTIKIDSTLSKGYGYNVIGRLGRGASSNIIISAHHDAHFKGVIDNASGVALMLLMARSMINLDIQRELYFISFTAEEYGEINTLYDYLIGSHHFFEKHREIPGKNWLFMNFDGIGEANGPVGITYTPELETYILDTVICLNEVVTSGFSLHPKPSLWLDQWPAVYNGLSSIALTNLGHKEFFKKFYHTQYDDTDLLSETIFKDYYITSYVLLRSFCDARVPYYDFSRPASQLIKTLNMDIYTYAIHNIQNIESLLANIAGGGARLYKLICEINEGRYPGGINPKKVIKALTLTRELFLKNTLYINPLELPPLKPYYLTEIYRDILKTLETGGDYQPRYLNWIKEFSVETVEWVIDKVMQEDNWARNKIPKLKINIEKGKISINEHEIIEDLIQNCTKLEETLDTLNNLIHSILELTGG